MRMDTTSRALSSELFRLTGWGCYTSDLEFSSWWPDEASDSSLFPRYSLGFLRGKLIEYGVPRADIERALYEGADAAASLLIPAVKQQHLERFDTGQERA